VYIYKMTHRENILKHLRLPKDSHPSLTDLATAFDIPREALQEIFNRGVGAWKNNISSVRLKKDFSKNYNIFKFPRSARLPKEMWAFARVYSFLDKGKTYHTADADVAKRYGL